MSDSIEKLKKERDENQQDIEKLEAEIIQTEHQLSRAKNRQKYLSKAERSRRTHHLCNLGGALEHYFPVTKNMDKVDMMYIFEKLSEISEVQKVFATWHPEPSQKRGEK